MQYRTFFLRFILISLGILTFFAMADNLASAQKVETKSRQVQVNMLVSTDWLAKNLKNPRVVILCIARDRKAYDEGHIPGARFMAWSEIVSTKNGVSNELAPVDQLKAAFEKAGIGDTARIVLYGDNNGLSATRTFFTLDYLGQANRSSVLDGGIEKWKSENRGLENESPSYGPIPFTLRLNPSVITSTETVRDYSWLSSNLDSAKVAIIDSRPAEQYTGAPNTRTGHIPGAANMFWQKQLNAKEQGTMKPVSELIKMYGELGVTPGEKVVTYCNSGVQASHSYFTLKYLGFDVSMYDGSFSEWVKQQDAPISTGTTKK